MLPFSYSHVMQHSYSGNDMTDKASRDKTLIKTSWISTIGNAVLSIFKIVVGLLSGSLAVISDGIDSAADVLISIVMIFTARIMSKPPNAKYVYGYEKAEAIASKILSLVIFYAGVQMLITSLTQLFKAEDRELPGVFAVYVTIFSIFGKLALSIYQYRKGKKIKSSLLIANAINMRGDVVISLGVLIGLFFTFVLNLPMLDVITGLVVSLFVIKSAIGIFIDTNVGLMDGVSDVTVYNKIFEAVEKIPGALNPHRIRSRQIGNMYMISLDIEADGSITLAEAHNIAEAVEDSIRHTVDHVYDIVVHIEPQGHSRKNEKYGIDKRV